MSMVNLENVSNVALSVENRVAYITIQNAPVNALSAKTLDDLSASIDFAAGDDGVKAVVITGAGKFFVAGADIKEFTAAFGDKDKGKAMSLKAQEVFNKLEGMTKPVIAAINGACLGGGLELAMSCHFRIAANEAKLGQPELNLGLIPGYGGTQRLPRLVNKSKALELILTGQVIGGAEAERIGLANKAVPLEELAEQAKRFAETIALEKSGPSTAATIAAVMKGAETTLEQGLKIEAELWAELFATEDMKEGVNAFIEKRKADFADR